MITTVTEINVDFPTGIICYLDFWEFLYYGVCEVMWYMVNIVK